MDVLYRSRNEARTIIGSFAGETTSMKLYHSVFLGVNVAGLLLSLAMPTQFGLFGLWFIFCGYIHYANLE